MKALVWHGDEHIRYDTVSDTAIEDRDYSDRSGLPRGAKRSRRLARKDSQIPADYRAEGTVAAFIPALAS